VYRQLLPVVKCTSGLAVARREIQKIFPASI
jgi:hypothetical protein